MRLDAVEVIAIDIPLTRNFGGSTYSVLNCDASEGGGVTDWRRAAALCAAASVQMAHHEKSQIAAHLLAAVPHGPYAECFADPERDPVWQTMWANRPAPRDGMMDVPSGPGFGLALDEAMVCRHCVYQARG